MKLTSEEINDLAENALNAACLHIQEQLNIKTGDAAGIFFTSTESEIIRIMFREYIQFELSLDQE